MARVREGLTTDPKKQQSRQRETDEIAEEREDSLPTKENSDNSENSPVDCYKNARSCTRSSPSSTGNRRGDIGSSDSNGEGDNRGQRVSPQPRPDYYKNARSDTRSPASSGQETSAHERPGQPDAKGGSHTPLPPGDPCKLKSESELSDHMEKAYSTEDLDSKVSEESQCYSEHDPVLPDQLWTKDA